VAERLSELGEDTRAVKVQIQDLAREYQRRRDSMRASPGRTEEMETIVTQMRTLAPTAFPLLDVLSRSDKPGERLAAISILEVIPQATHLDWLARRLGKTNDGESVEKPFVGYHAAIALLSAAKALGNRHWSGIAAAIATAKERHKLALPKGYLHTDRYETLLEAERALAKRRPAQ
jgi:hypothetical protein